uniref:Nuclear transcription factor Y subunit n=2 Tax=Macrostomum lignano TaxID=282301 RepID=A0A1I8I9T9_9PLAT
QCSSGFEFNFNKLIVDSRLNQKHFNPARQLASLYIVLKVRVVMATFSQPPGVPSPIMQVVRQPPPPQPRRCQVHSEAARMPVPSVYDPYPPDPPADVPIPKRVNPLRPQPPERMTCVTETGDPHYQNQQRLAMLERKQFHRFHNAWSRYYYGSVAEKELHNRYFREGLKQQMRDSDEKNRRVFREKAQESSVAFSRDRQDIESEQVQRASKHQFLTQYRDANKMMMEEKAQRLRAERQRELQFDREQLKYNPINWSCSLK